ncbi:hypothetical protein ABZY93_21910 [Streptomyces smyrnaeus]|uniref:hypothetical protein n=1 Tax=Streptomyces smyrnaeus TaxID=1387713 RepID=UPI0033B2FB64
MTISHAETQSSEPSPPANLHLRLVEKAEVKRTEAGRFAVALNLYEGSTKRQSISLVLTAEEVAETYIRLGALLPAHDEGEQ